MIQTVGNNFGGGPISLTAYLSDKIIVLNGKFTVDTTTEEYRNASVLELYFDDLPMNKSAVSTCFMQSEQLKWPGESYETLYKFGTVLKMWIKDKNTICIEKLGIYDENGSFTIAIGSMFTKLGVREEITLYDQTRLTFTYPAEQSYLDEDICVITDDWVFLHIVFSGTSAPRDGNPYLINLGGFPTDVSMDFVIGGSTHQSDYPGSSMSFGKIENGVMSIDGMRDHFRATGYEAFIFAFGVRNTYNQ